MSNVSPAMRYVLRFRNSSPIRNFLLNRANSLGLYIEQFARNFLARSTNDNFELFEGALSREIRTMEVRLGRPHFTFQQWISTRQRLARAKNTLRRGLRNWRSIRESVRELPVAVARRRPSDYYAYQFDEGREEDRINNMNKGYAFNFGGWRERFRRNAVTPGAYKVSMPFPDRLTVPWVKATPLLEVDNWAQARRITDEDTRNRHRLARARNVLRRGIRNRISYLNRPRSDRYALMVQEHIQEEERRRAKRGRK